MRTISPIGPEVACRRVRVNLGSRSYDIVVGAGAISLTGHELQRLGAGRPAAVLSNRGVLRRFGDALVRSLEGCGFEVQTLTVPPGEKSKNLRQVARIYDALGAAGFNRDGTLIALGGGVVGDLAGFVAGTYMRGIRLVQVPTTLLAQIDSGIGGKSAVNHPRAKNLIGVFHQPALVVADPDALRSLPPSELRFGLAEAVKYGMAMDRVLLEMLEGFTPKSLEEIVYRAAALKARVVEEDEFDLGAREVLNYGHTVGHAIEVALPGRFTHGAAVAIGMQVEARAAVRLGLLAEADAARQAALLERLGLPVMVPAGPPGPLLEAMQLDKKRRGGRIRCTLPEGIGRARLGVEVPDTLMEEVIMECQESSQAAAHPGGA
ncbi:MAG: 3-dehydroquinate synthase [bacterium]|nr:3-dehydroquinate synthase [bacterium]